MTGVDARRLLKAYMKHVVDCESVSFAGPMEFAEWPGLTPPERQMLAEVEAEVMKEYRNG